MGGAVSYEPGTPVAVGKGVYDAEARDAGVCLHRAPQCRLFTHSKFRAPRVGFLVSG